MARNKRTPAVSEEEAKIEAEIIAAGVEAFEEGFAEAAPLAERGEQWITAEEIRRLEDAGPQIAAALAESLGSDQSDPMDAHSAPDEPAEPEHVAEEVAEELEEGLQPPLDGMPPAPELWPAVEAAGKVHKISRIRLGVSGALELFAGRPHDVELASRLTHGREFGITIRGRVDETGHKAERSNGVLVGIMGTAKFKAIELVDEEQYYEELYSLEDRVNAGMGALEDLITDMREAGRRDAAPVDPRIFARATVTALARVQRAFLMGDTDIPSDLDDDEARRRRRPTFVEFLEAVAQEEPDDLEAVCLCGHPRKAHSPEGLEPCSEIRVIELGDGSIARNRCSCHAFRGAPAPLEDVCFNCGHAEHVDDFPGCEASVMRQQMNFERELVDVPMACECRSWQPRAAAAPVCTCWTGPGEPPAHAFNCDLAPADPAFGPESTAEDADSGSDIGASHEGEESEPTELEGALAASLAIAQGAAEEPSPAPGGVRERLGGPSLRPVADPDRQCGIVHPGHVNPCPFDAFECELPGPAPEPSNV